MTHPQSQFVSLLCFYFLVKNFCFSKRNTQDDLLKTQKIVYQHLRQFECIFRICKHSFVFLYIVITSLPHNVKDFLIFFPRCDSKRAGKKKLQIVICPT